MNRRVFVAGSLAALAHTWLAVPARAAGPAFLSAYKSRRFDTPNGLLGPSDYAMGPLNRFGEQLYMVAVPDAWKERGKAFGSHYNVLAAGIAGKRQVAVLSGEVCCVEFLDGGKLVRDIVTDAEYTELDSGIRTVKDFRPVKR